MSTIRIRQLDGVKNRRDYYQIQPSRIIVKNGWNPRTDFSGEEELRDSIIENGVLVPLRVKRGADDSIILIDGERRLRAALRAIDEGYDIATVPCIFERPQVSDIEAMFVSLVTNQGKPLDPGEEAMAFQRLINWGQSKSEIAQRIGKSIGFVSQRLSLVDASPQIKAALSNRDVTINDAITIVKQSGGDILAQDMALSCVPEKKPRVRRTPRELILDKAAKMDKDELAALVRDLEGLLCS